MTKETLQSYLNQQVKVIDVLQQEIVGTLVNLTDDSLVLQTSRNTVVISYDYVVQFLVKNSKQANLVKCGGLVRRAVLSRKGVIS